MSDVRDVIVALRETPTSARVQGQEDGPGASATTLISSLQENVGKVLLERKRQHDDVKANVWRVYGAPGGLFGGGAVKERGCRGVCGDDRGRLTR